MNRYLILDREGIPVARGTSKDKKNDTILRIQLDYPERISFNNNDYVTLVGTLQDMAGLEGHVLRMEKGVLYVEPIRRIGEEVRQNLRMPVAFDSYLYPISGNWKGRIPIVSHDLSCGGIAFYTGAQLNIGEIAEIVLPVTSNPLLLRIKILRKTESKPGQNLYAACFVDMIHDEEIMVREAVFNIQIARKKER